MSGSGDSVVLKKTPFSILFVCAGNICRSPTAEGVFRRLVTQAGLEKSFHIESRDTDGWHAGEKAHLDTRSVALRRGVSLEDHRAKQVTHADFRDYDLIVVMDRSNLAHLKRMSPESEEKLVLLREYDADENDLDVPDPYEGGLDGFERVYDIIHRSCRALVESLTGQQR